MASFAAKMFLRGVKSPLYLISPDYDTLSAWMVQPDKLAKACVQTNGQPITIKADEVVSILGPESNAGPVMAPLTADEMAAIDIAFGHGEAALEAYEEEVTSEARQGAKAWVEKMRAAFNEQHLSSLTMGDAEDRANAEVWLDSGDVVRAIRTAGPDHVARRVGECSFGSDALVELDDVASKASSWDLRTMVCMPATVHSR